MLKPVAQLAAVGIVGILAAKLLGMLMLPFLGILIGFVLWVGKLFLIAALIYFGYRLFRKMVERPSEA
jgi:predicted transporter